MVKEHKITVLIASALIVVGAACFLIRFKALPRPPLGPGESIWRLTYNVDLTRFESGRVHIAIPDNTAHARIFRESFSHHGVWMDLLRARTTLGREVVVVPLLGHKRGRFWAEFDVHLSRDEKWSRPAPKSTLSTQEITHYLRGEPDIQVDSALVAERLQQFRAVGGVKTQLLERIFEYCAENIAAAEPDGPQDANGTLEQARGTDLGRARAMVALCRAARIPARVVTGFSLDAPPEPAIRHWVEVWAKKGWRAYDPESGYFGEVPATLLPVRWDGDAVVKAPAATEHRALYAVRRTRPAPILSTSSRHGWTQVLDLTRLSPGMQQTLTLILLLPFAALVTALLRNVVGLNSFGTFTPGLVALSFVQADWRTGTVVLLIVLVIGIFGRFLLNRLRLLMVARLSVILTLVILCMVLAISVLDYLTLTPSASAVLLPLVILTMIVERINITAEEEGYGAVLKILAGTAVVAVCCFWVLRIHFLSRVALTFPEVHTFTIAALLLIGRYSGYRLTELWRFRDLAAADSSEDK